jgi:hypothetical protein
MLTRNLPTIHKFKTSLVRGAVSVRGARQRFQRRVSGFRGPVVSPAPETAEEPKFALGRAPGGWYLSPMLTGVLSTGLLALLAWIPAARSQASVQRAELRDRVVSAATVFGGPADSPLRALSPTTARVWVAPHRRSAAPQGGNSRNNDGVQPARAAASGATHSFAARRDLAHCSGYREKRLTIPHDATAPPPNRW